MKIRDLHRWDVTPKEAVSIQRNLAQRIVITPFAGTPRLVAGCDISYDKNVNRLYAGIVVLSTSPFELVEVQTAVAEPTFPYVPGLLSFLEIPPLIACFERVASRPGVVMCDGQGYAHPRRMGLACHVGLLIDIPTIGCAKSRLTGEAEEPGILRGSSVPLMDNGEQIGCVVRSKDNVKPLYVSPGHRITIEDSVRIVLECCTKYRQPEPTRLAHLTVNHLRMNYRSS